MKTIKTSRQDVFQTPKRCWICKSINYLAQLSNRHLLQWYVRYFTKTVFRHLSKMLIETLKSCLHDVFQTPKKCRISNLEDTLHSFLLLHKTFGKNVSKASCKTDFNTFLKSGLKVILKLSSQTCCITLCRFYIEDEVWIDKKLCYRKIKYITSSSENFKVYLQ